MLDLAKLLGRRRRSPSAAHFARQLCHQRVMAAAWAGDYPAFLGWRRARREWPEGKAVRRE